VTTAAPALNCGRSRVPAPADLAHKVRARLASEPLSSDRPPACPLATASQYATLILVASLSALFGWPLASSFEQRRLERDLVAAHVRLLRQDDSV
jgi:hypothetical protein